MVVLPSSSTHCSAVLRSVMIPVMGSAQATCATTRLITIAIITAIVFIERFMVLLLLWIGFIFLGLIFQAVKTL
jgi:hypothetical protein